METKKHSKMAWLWENMKGYRAIYLIGILVTIAYNVMHFWFFIYIIYIKFTLFLILVLEIFCNLL